MRLLFLSHCTPNPPDKGEKIRAFHELIRLTEKHEVHLVCFARNLSDMAAARELEGRCRSVYVEMLPFHSSLAKAVPLFLAGGCLNMKFYWSNRMAGQVAKLASAEPFDAAVAISVPMAPYVPPGMRFLLDMQDVDSEKWIQYAQTRHPAFLYAAEARRLRRMEVYWAHAAHLTLFTTRSEELLFQSFGGGARTAFLENGVDLEYFDPERTAASRELLGRRFALFLGTMDYHPNIEAAQWFAREALPEIRKRDAGFEFLIVGRSPRQSVLTLARIPGVAVTGGVADTRPYLAAARAVVAPLRIARGIQNKVLEGLAMGKRVLVSPSVGKTFGDSLPVGVDVCRDAGDYRAALDAVTDSADPAIRIAAGSRFNWPRNLNVLAEALEALA